MVCLASGARCTVYGIQFKCTVYIVHHTMADVQCTAYSVQRTVYSVQCTVYSVQRFCWPGVIQLGWLIWLVTERQAHGVCVCCCSLLFRCFVVCCCSVLVVGEVVGWLVVGVLIVAVFVRR